MHDGRGTTQRHPDARGTGTAAALRLWPVESVHTVSLLPDCLAARLPDTVEEVEATMCATEQVPSWRRRGKLVAGLGERVAVQGWTCCPGRRVQPCRKPLHTPRERLGDADDRDVLAEIVLTSSAHPGDLAALGHSPVDAALIFRPGSGLRSTVPTAEGIVLFKRTAARLAEHDLS